jgi:uncharacterized RDD family membrane protein YckC
MNTELQTPTLRCRMASWIYEGILMFGVFFLSDYLFDTLSQSRHALQNLNARQAFLFVIAGIYFVWFWSHGQTLAMKTWRIRLVDCNGHAVSQMRALARYFLSWIWFLPPLALWAPLQLGVLGLALLFAGWVTVWAILSRFQAQNQFWHDAWAGTRLIQSEPLSR